MIFSTPFVIFMSSAFILVSSEPIECQAMDDLLAHKLPHIINMSEFQQCAIDQNSSSFHCRSQTHTDEFIGLTIISCDMEPIIELEANIPSYGISSWKAKVGDNSFLLIDGFTFPQTSERLKSKQGFIQTSVKKSNKADSIIFSLMLKGYELPLNSAHKYSQSSCIEKQIISEQMLSCELLGKADRQPLCSITKLFDCQPTETCRQIGQTRKGECVCNQELTRNGDGTCSVSSAEISLSTPAPTTPGNSRPLTPIVISFLLCVAAVIGLYFVMKFNLFQRLRAKVTRHRFRRLVVQDLDYDDSSLA